MSNSRGLIAHPSLNSDTTDRVLIYPLVVTGSPGRLPTALPLQACLPAVVHREPWLAMRGSPAV